MQRIVRSIRALLKILGTVFGVACANATAPVPQAPNTEPPGGVDNSVTPPGGPVLTYRYGAKFEPPIGRVVHGLGQWMEYNTKYAALLPTAHQPASELSFTPIADSVRPWNPSQILAGLQAMDARGRIPLMNLSLYAGQPTQAELATMSDKLFGVDDEIANGTKWDSRLQDFANVLKAYKKPVMLRIGGEFNGWWNGYHPYDFPKAYRKIAAMIRATGASNVAFVWCY
ncbi:MAG: hypothetical protein FJ202_00405 [Gemmatimonadetes bacterium]|nr:hypothetical protein [Gemmatimonadota bacterium]